MPSRAMSAGARPINSSPANRIEPLEARTSPMMALHSVVLPMPLRPTTAIAVCRNLRSTPCNACERPYKTLRVLISSTGAPLGRATKRAATAASEVKFLHLVVGLDLRGRAFLENAAVVQHCHALDDAQGHIHIVLDDDEADVLRHRGKDLDQLRPLRGRQAGGRLVEQDETRCAGQRQGDFELALLAVAQLSHQAMA